MNPNTEDLKGRAKEAVGDLTDNDDLKRAGQADRNAAKAKDAIDSVGTNAKSLVDEVNDTFHPSDKNYGARAREASLRLVGGKPAMTVGTGI